MDMVTARERSHSSGKAGVPRDRGWVAESWSGWFASHFERYSSSRAAI